MRNPASDEMEGATYQPESCHLTCVLWHVCTPPPHTHQQKKKKEKDWLEGPKPLKNKITKCMTKIFVAFNENMYVSYGVRLGKNQ